MKKLLTILIIAFSLAQVFGQDNLLPIRQNNYWGFIDNNGKIIIPAKYLSVGEFGKNDYTFFATRNTLGLVKKTGEEIFFKNINGLVVIDNESIAIRKDTLWGVSTYNKEIIIDIKFSKITKDELGLYKVRLGDSLGIKASSGKTLLHTRFNLITRLSESGYYCETTDSSFIFNINGKIIKKGKLGSLNGKYWPTIIESSLDGLANVFFEVETGKTSDTIKKYNYIGNYIFGIEIDNTHALYHSQKGVIYTNKLPFTAQVQPSGNISISCNGKLGILQSSGTELLPVIFDEITPEDNLIKVRIGSYFGMYSQSGKELLKPIYESISTHSSGSYILQKNGELGLAKPNGELLFAPAFNALEIDKKQIRGKKEQEMAFYDIDSKWNIIDFYKFKSVQTIYLDGDISIIPEEISPENNNYFGWYMTNRNFNWGFRRQDSTLRHAPRFYKIKSFPQTGYTITWENKKASQVEKFLDGYYSQDKKCALTFTNDGNYFLTPKYWHIYKSELRNANCAYVRTLKYDGKQQIIMRTGVVLKQNFDFIDTLVEDMARFNIGGKPLVIENKKNKTNICTQLEYRQQNGFDSTDYSFSERADYRSKYIEIAYGKWGFVNNEGSVVINANFDFVYPFYKGTAIVKYQNKWGVINKSGEFIIQPEYYKVDRLERNGQMYFQVFKPEPRFGIIDTQGVTIIYPEYKNASNFINGYLAVKTKKGWTFLDSTLQPIHNAVFEEVRDFKNNRAAVKLYGKWGFINKSGILVIQHLYAKVLDFNQNRTWVLENGKWYLINENGQKVTESVFNSPNNFKYGVSFTKTEKSEKYGLVNTKGSFIVKPKFDNVANYNSYGIAIVEKNKLLALINKDGKLITDYIFTKIDSFSHQWAHASTLSGPVILHKSGKYQPIDADLYELGYFSNGMALVKKDGFFGYLDTLGKVAISCKYTKATHFSEGFAFVKKIGSPSICINNKSETAFTINAWPIAHFKEGRAIIRKNGTCQFIDSTGSALFDLTFKQALPFSENIGRVKIGKKWAVINKYGHVLNTPKYVKIKNYNGAYTVVKRSGNYGLYNAEGNVVLDVMFDEMNLLDEHFFFVSVNDKIGHFDLDKGWIWEPAR